MLFSNTDNDPIPEQVAQLSQEVHNNDLLQLLVFNMQKFEFEVSVPCEHDAIPVFPFPLTPSFSL
jgi:hypothetical protein